MLKRWLVGLGLITAPAPVRTYLWVSSFVGVAPALAYVAWRYRDKIAAALGRPRLAASRSRPIPATHAPLGPQARAL